jgi:hypothetical protein
MTVGFDCDVGRLGKEAALLDVVVADELKGLALGKGRGLVIERSIEKW